MKIQWNLPLSQSSQKPSSYTFIFINASSKKKRKRRIVPRNDTVLFRQRHFARSLPIYKCLEFYRRCELRRPRCRHLMLLEAQGRPT